MICCPNPYAYHMSLFYCNSTSMSFDSSRLPATHHSAREVLPVTANVSSTQRSF